MRSAISFILFALCAAATAKAESIEHRFLFPPENIQNWKSSGIQLQLAKREKPLVLETLVDGSDAVETQEIRELSLACDIHSSVLGFSKISISPEAIFTLSSVVNISKGGQQCFDSKVFNFLSKNRTSDGAQAYLSVTCYSTTKNDPCFGKKLDDAKTLLKLLGLHGAVVRSTRERAETKIRFEAPALDSPAANQFRGI